MENGKSDQEQDYLEQLIDRVVKAQASYASFPQEKVDDIFRKAAAAASAMRIQLAKAAREETGMGVTEDKVIKNQFASEYIYNKYKDEKTCGVIEVDNTYGIKRVAEPIGIIAGIIPTTNPTSTAIFKSLLALKTRNAIIFSPHPRAKHCTIMAAKIVRDAAVAAGAPEDIIGWLEEPTIELSNKLMHHPKINLILATGGPGMVKAAYSSGKPALGVGPGNTPAIIDETAHLRMAVSGILISKTFDNGMICASEQSVIVVDAVYDVIRREFLDRGAYILSPEEKQKVGAIILKDGRINADIVGQSAEQIAAMADVTVPKDAKVLMAECADVGIGEPFSYEKLSPTLALYRVADFKAAVDLADRLVRFGGLGHTSVLYTDARNTDRIDYAGSRLKTSRVLINTPSSQGAIGDIYNFKLDPSLTLGCGSWGGNSVSENVGIRHLINVKTIAERRENMLWFRVPPKIYFKYGCLPIALQELVGKKRAFVVTDKPLFDLGYTYKITDVLEALKIDFEVFFEVEPDPTFSCVNKGLERIKGFRPDVFIALGGGSPMDATKIMWAMYEHPDITFDGLAQRFMDIRKRIYNVPEHTRKSIMVAIPTTSGTGSEVTPFAVVTDDETGIKYPVTDYEFTPDMAIVDPELVMNMPKKLTAYSGIDAMVHGIEAYVSIYANEYTNGQALEGMRLLNKYLPDAYLKGAAAVKAREKTHYASCLTGMAFANAFLGVCHSMAHKLGAAFHLPHGLANALLISQVIRYNATDVPKKQAAFAQYKYPLAIDRYGKIADYLGVQGSTPAEKVEGLIARMQDLKKILDLPMSIREAGVNEAEFRAQLDELSELAFDDQCTGGNPRFPLIPEIKELYLKAWNGDLS
jgi:acetaldehyde dehydrogenase/alcohol dehydrogenase